MEPLYAFLAGAGVGAAGVYLFYVGRLARLDAELKSEREKHRWTEEAKATLAEAFRLLAAKNLEEANQKLVESARALFDRLDREVKGGLDAHAAALRGTIEPLKEALSALERRLAALEKDREGAYRALAEQLRLLREEQGALKEAAQRLRAALTAERTRGHWGEIQLKRVVELSGMAPHVDFHLQPSTERGRPDLLVFLPGGGVVPVDAKAPMTAFLEALDATEPAEREKKLKAHAAALRARIKELAERAYWRGLPGAPEFAVVFIPSEAALHAALEADPTLLEDALAQRVLPASPITLLALLKSVAYGWQQRRLSEEARRIGEEARELVERFATFNRHLGKVGKKLKDSVEAYNQAVGSLERRLLPLAGRIAERAGKANALDPPPPLEALPRDYGDDPESPK